MKTTRYIVLGLLITLALSISAREFEKGEKLYFNATPASATWWKNGTYEHTTRLWGRLVDGSKEYWIEAKWYGSDNCYLEIPNDPNAIRNWSKLVLYRCDYNNRNNVQNQTGEIDLDKAPSDKNYIQNFYYDYDGGTKNGANWWNLTLTPEGNPSSSTVDNIKKELMEVCLSSVGDPLSLQPILAGSPLTYDYSHSAANAWFKWNGSKWVALDGQSTGFYSSNNTWGYEGGTQLKETIGAANSHTYYFLWTAKPSRRRFVEVAVTKDCSPTCEITDFGVVTSNVNAHDSTYILDGIVAFKDATGQTLRISVTDAKGVHYVDYTNPVTPHIFSLSGLYADGTTGVIAKAEFVGTPYSATASFNAPNAITGISTTVINKTPGEVATFTPATPGTDGFIWHDGNTTDHTRDIPAYNFDTTIVYTYYEYENPPTVGGNLIKNGDFSDASFDYGTPYYKLDVKGSNISEYNYWGKDVTNKSDFYTEHKDGDDFISGGMAIVTSANAFWKRYTKNIEKKSGTHFALFDADNSGSKKAWHIATNATTQPDLKLAKGTNYMFSFWVANINNYGEMNNAAKLQFAIRYKQGGSWSAEELLGKPIDLNNYLDNLWHQNSYVYTSPVDADDVEIMVRDLNASANPGGNDFALDDIKFQPISVVSQAIKHCQRFVLNIYEPPTIVDQPVITIMQTPACGKTDFTIQVDVSYSTLNNKFPITLQLSDDVYGDLFATPVTIDPSVNPNSISFTLKSDDYPMLVADGAVHTLTAKITRIDGAGVDKGGSNNATYTAPGVPAINTPATTAQNVACDKTTFDLQVVTEYNAFKGSKLHYDWDGVEWTDAENPSLSYKESTLQTATGKLKNLDADGKNHTLRVYSDNALDCEKTITIPAPYSPQVISTEATVLPYACGDTEYHVQITVNHANSQGKDLVITDEAGHSKTLTSSDPTYASPATWTFDMPWENPVASHTFKAYFVGANSCKDDASHLGKYTSPAEPELTVTPSVINPECDVTTYSLRLDLTYTNQRGNNILANVDGGTDVSKVNSHKSQITSENEFILIENLPADGKVHTFNLRFDDASDCDTLNGKFTAPFGPKIGAATATVLPYACGDNKYDVTVEVPFTNGQGHNLIIEDWKGNKQSLTTADTDIKATHTFSYAWETPTAHEYKVYFVGAETCNNHKPSFTAPAKPELTVTPSVIDPACDVTTYSLRLNLTYTNQRGNNILANVDGGDDVTKPNTHKSQVTTEAEFILIENLPADGKVHTFNLRFDDASDCDTLNGKFTAPYGPQIGAATATLLPYACGDAKYQVKVEVPFTNGQGHDLIIEDWKGDKQSLTTAATDTKAEYTFSYDWETPATHEYKIYFVGAESCDNHKPSFTSPAEPKLEKVVTDIPTEVACGATTFDMSVTFEYINQDGTALDVNVDDTIHGTLSSPFVPNSMTRQTVKATFTGLPADGAKARKLNIVFIGGTHTCGPEQVPFDAPITPAIDTAKVAFSAPGCNDLTTTLTFGLNYTYQQGTLTYWVDALPAQTATYSVANPAAQTLTGLTVADIPADGKNDHVLHVSFDGANSCVKSYALPAVPFSPVIDNVTITGVPTIVECDAENYQVAVSFNAHYTPVPADKKIVLTYDSLCDTKTIASLALTDFPYNLTLHNIANGNHSIFVAFEDTPDCKKEVTYISPARETCVKDTAHICLGETYPWPGHGTYTPTTTGEHQYKDNTDSLFLFVHADPNITLLATDMICEDENEIRLPFAITSGTPNRFDVVIADQNFSQDYDGKDTIVLARPASIPAGTYTATVTVRDSLVTCFNTVQTTFTIALSDHVFSKWTDVLFVDNSDKLFTAYQWFADGVAMSGETLQRLYDPKGLSGSNILYYCQLTTTDGKTLYTCPQTFDDVTPSRTVDTTPAKVKATTMYDSMGRVIKTTPHFGIYIVVEELENGEIRTHKIAVYE